MSPAAIAARREVHATGRWVPAFIDLQIAIDNSRQDQTYNTPALATLFLLAEQLDWFNAQGGLPGRPSARRSPASRLYTWADKSPYAIAVRHRPESALRRGRHHRLRRQRRRRRRRRRSLRANGIVDTEPYRKLGRNQLRIAMFPAVEPDDIEALTACIDYVVERLS